MRTWRDLPPTGNPIELSADPAASPAFTGYRAHWVNSGTAALALALAVARRRQSQIRAPEVVLPGYGCPDLVTAAVHAGVQPVLADIGAGDPGYDFQSVHQAMSVNTVAVVAVNFLGIRERLAGLREMLRQWPAAMLVEDDAQWFPEPADAPGLSGDAVVLSCGRGKPVSLLGGGALLLEESMTLDDSLIRPAAHAGAALPWKMRAYNLLLRPSLYGLMSRNPLLQLGRTVYKPLHGITAMDERRKLLLPRNVAAYLARPQTVAAHIHAALPASMDLPAQFGERSARLLRYPILCADRRQRDVLWERLRRAGLGVSAMYRQALPQIEGVNALVTVRGDLSGARSFADRLLTLPTHSGVDAASVARMTASLCG